MPRNSFIADESAADMAQTFNVPQVHEDDALTPQTIAAEIYHPHRDITSDRRQQLEGSVESPYVMLERIENEAHQQAPYYPGAYHQVDAFSETDRLWQQHSLDQYIQRQHFPPALAEPAFISQDSPRRVRSAAVEVDPELFNPPLPDSDRLQAVTRPNIPFLTENGDQKRFSLIRGCKRSSDDVEVPSAQTKKLKLTARAPSAANTTPSAPADMSSPPLVQSKSRKSGNIRSQATASTCPPLNVEVGLYELCAFFPDSFQMPEFANRAMRNKACMRLVAQMQLHTRNQLTTKTLQTVVNRLKYQFNFAGKSIYANKIAAGQTWTVGLAEGKGLQLGLTTNAWRLRGKYRGKQVNFNDVNLIGIANAVPRENWPTRQDRVVLTQCLEYAVAHPEEKLTTRDWAALIGHHRFTAPLASGVHASRDAEAVLR